MSATRLRLGVHGPTLGHDLISFPPSIQRQFTCIRAPVGKDEGLLLGIVDGDTPSVEFSPEAETIFRQVLAQRA